MSNPEIFLVKENPEDKSNNFDNIQKKPRLKFENNRHESVSEEAESERRDSCTESRQEEASSSLGQKVKDEDDGFRTPTGSINRIPEAKQCPPPPRKPKPSLKRKASHSFSYRHPLDLSKEVELLFPAHQNNLPSDSRISTKKVRRAKNTQ